MKAMVLESHSLVDDSPLSLIDVPMPEPGAREIRIKVLSCGICRTDLHVIEGELPTKTMPIIPGHQVVGLVDKVGRDCKFYQGGERVGIPWLGYTCGTCQYCKSDKENLCPESLYTGYSQQGGYAEYAVAKEDFVYLIPDFLSYEEAAPLLCAGIIGYRALTRSLLPKAGSLAVFGFGSSAHIVTQIAHHRSSQVFAISRDNEHLAFAKKLGVSWAGKKASDIPQKVDSAIIFAPAGELVPQALSILKRGGTLSLAGIHMTPIPKLDYQKHLFYEKNIHSVTSNTRADGQSLLREVTESQIRPSVTTYPLEMANQALQDLKHDRIQGTGVLVFTY